MHDIRQSQFPWHRPIPPVVAGQPHPARPEARFAATEASLDALSMIVSGPCQRHTGPLSHEHVMAYALGLMRLRACAAAAGLQRLTKACDALAVTVSRLIDDPSPPCDTHCETLTRFVRHARAMLQLARSRRAPDGQRAG